MRDCTGDKHVFKAESDIIAEAFLKEDKASDEKIVIIPPLTSIKEEEECSGENGDMQATALQECKIPSAKMKELDAYV